MQTRAIFFDRDGVLNDSLDRGGNFFVRGKKVQWTAPFAYEEFRIKPKVIEVLKTAQAAGFLTILATNQPDVAYGLLPQKEYDRIMAEVATWPLDDIFVCHHTRDENCACKKPKPGMLLDAAKKWNIDLAQSYMVGDTESDMKAARAAGVASVLLRAPYNKDIVGEYEIESLPDLIFLLKNGTIA